MHKDLPYVVQVKSTYPFFENIAAFDLKCIAKEYAESCAKVNPNFVYRVITATKED